jgi:hypothetical protein
MPDIARRWQGVDGSMMKAIQRKRFTAGKGLVHGRSAIAEPRVRCALADVAAGLRPEVIWSASTGGDHEVPAESAT